MNRIILRPDTPHYAQEVDENGIHKRWVPKPDTESKKRKYTSRYGINEILIFHKMEVSNEKCFFCGRDKTMLGKNETMEIDHIRQLNEMGEDTLENIQILCSACHKLRHWATTYMRIHMEK